MSHSTFPVPESEQLQWIQDAPGIWHSTGGHYEHFAFDLGADSSTPHYPWYLRRSDGLYARITNLGRVKDMAELWERGMFPQPAGEHSGFERW